MVVKMGGKMIRYEALDVQVLAVAVQGEIGDWAGYIGAVEGNNHDREFNKVAEHGTKLPYKIARLLFPDFDLQFVWRR